MAFTAKPISAERAERLGIINPQAHFSVMPTSPGMPSGKFRPPHPACPTRAGHNAARGEARTIDLSTLPLLKGKKALVTGIANDQSIAWGCAKAFRAFGADLAISPRHCTAHRRGAWIGTLLLCHVAIPHLPKSRDLAHRARERAGRANFSFPRVSRPQRMQRPSPFPKLCGASGLVRC